MYQDYPSTRTLKSILSDIAELEMVERACISAIRRAVKNGDQYAIADHRNSRDEVSAKIDALYREADDISKPL